MKIFEENLTRYYMDRSTGSEPKWTKSIPSSAVCNWFYAFFVINAFVLGLLILTAIYTLVTPTIPRAIKALDIFKIILNMMISGTSTLFFYIICDRSLKPV
jgi:hypothetical protein